MEALTPIRHSRVAFWKPGMNPVLWILPSSLPFWGNIVKKEWRDSHTSLRRYSSFVMERMILLRTFRVREKKNGRHEGLKSEESKDQTR